MRSVSPSSRVAGHANNIGLAFVASLNGYSAIACVPGGAGVRLRQICASCSTTLQCRAARGFVEDRAGLSEHVGQLHRRRIRADHAHVRQEVVCVVKRADIRRGHRANRVGIAAGFERERVRCPVDQLADRPPADGLRIFVRADHLVVDGALLFEMELAVGRFVDADVAHLAPDLLVGFIRVQHRIELIGERAPIRVGTGDGLERVRRAPLLGERVRRHQRHRVVRAERAPAIALAEQQAASLACAVSPLSLVGDVVTQRYACGALSILNVVDREAGAIVHEARADRLAGIVEVHGANREPTHVLTFAQRLEPRRSRRSRARRRGRWSNRGGTAVGIGFEEHAATRSSDVKIELRIAQLYHRSRGSAVIRLAAPRRQRPAANQRASKFVEIATDRDPWSPIPFLASRLQYGLA